MSDLNDLLALSVPVVLPPRLDDLLIRIRIRSVVPVPQFGIRADCLNNDHDMRTWVEGVYAVRDFRLRKCAYCAGVEVRDISLDANIGGSRLARRRINALRGWYSAPRPRGREYMGSLGSVRR